MSKPKATVIEWTDYVPDIDTEPTEDDPMPMRPVLTWSVLDESGRVCLVTTSKPSKAVQDKAVKP